METHIAINRATKSALTELKRGDDTYDDVIKRLIENAKLVPVASA